MSWIKNGKKFARMCYATPFENRIIPDEDLNYSMLPAPNIWYRGKSMPSKKHHKSGKGVAS